MKKHKKNTPMFEPQKMLLSENSPFTVKEAYKTLRTNVMFSLPGNESKCIGVVSADRGDGKSSIALNLAISFAQINKKVIVVDCDLRLPTIASKLGIQAKPGLKSYYLGTIKGIVPSIICAMLAGILIDLLHFGGWIGLAVDLSAMLCVYFAALCLFGMNKYEKNLIFGIVKKVLRR